MDDPPERVIPEWNFDEWASTNFLSPNAVEKLRKANILLLDTLALMEYEELLHMKLLPGDHAIIRREWRSIRKHVGLETGASGPASVVNRSDDSASGLHAVNRPPTEPAAVAGPSAASPVGGTGVAENLPEPVPVTRTSARAPNCREREGTCCLQAFRPATQLLCRASVKTTI